MPAVDGVEVRLHRQGAPLLVWLGDPLSAGRSDASEEALARDLAAASGWSVAEVRYSDPAIETFPAPLTHAYRCLGHFREQEGGAAPVAIGGHGFGAGLAAGATLLALRFAEPPPSALVLLAPLLDARLASPSWHRHGEEQRRRIDEALAAYAPGLDRADPLLSPLLAEAVDGFPPTAIVTAAADPMRDDGERFAERLRDAGVAGLGHRYPETDHAQATGGETSAEGAVVLRGLASALRVILSRSTQSGAPSSSPRADARRPAPF